MDISPAVTFCDYLTVSQEHPAHEPFFESMHCVYDKQGNEIDHWLKPQQILGAFNSSSIIKSDGRRVSYSGNPSRWDRPENYHGLDLDRAKNLVNQQMRSRDLPEFTDGETLKNASGKSFYTGAKFSRIDICTNIATGSAANLRDYLNHQRTQNHGRLKYSEDEGTIYYGRHSAHRLVRIYDKGQQVIDAVLPKTEDPEYISDLATYLLDNGIFRIEIENRRNLKSLNCRTWARATHANLCQQFIKDTSAMTDEIETPDYGDMPVEALKTLGLYMMGVDVRKTLHRNTFSKHRKILKKYGYDISSKNIHLLQPKVKIITLTPAGIPDFYRKSPHLAAV